MMQEDAAAQITNIVRYILVWRDKRVYRPPADPKMPKGYVSAGDYYTSEYDMHVVYW